MNRQSVGEHITTDQQQAVEDRVQHGRLLIRTRTKAEDTPVAGIRQAA